MTVENVRKQKRFHPRCGTSFIFVILIISIFLSSALVVAFPSIDDNRVIWMIVKLSLLPLTVGIGYEFIKYAGKHNNIITRVLSAPGLWMQRITTQEPTDDIIEVGIEAIRTVLYGDEPEQTEGDGSDAKEQEN